MQNILNILIFKRFAKSITIILLFCILSLKYVETFHPHQETVHKPITESSNQSFYNTEKFKSTADCPICNWLTSFHSNFTFDLQTISFFSTDQEFEALVASKPSSSIHFTNSGRSPPIL